MHPYIYRFFNAREGIYPVFYKKIAIRNYVKMIQEFPKKTFYLMTAGSILRPQWGSWSLGLDPGVAQLDSGRMNKCMAVKVQIVLIQQTQIHQNESSGSSAFQLQYITHPVENCRFGSLRLQLYQILINIVSWLSNKSQRPWTSHEILTIFEKYLGLSHVHLVVHVVP